MLSEQEKSDYLFNKVLPIYKPMVNLLGCRIGLVDWEVRLIWLSESLRRFCGFDKDTLYSGKHIHHELSVGFVEKFCTLNEVSLEDFISVTQKIRETIKKVIKTRKVINFIVVMPLHKTFQGYARTAVPIIHPSGEVIAVQISGHHFSFFGIQEFINILANGSVPNKKFYPETVSNEFYRNLKLSPRQKEVLFLVSQGISQDYAAQILGIKRGTLSKIITDQICPKFDIFPPHYITLLDTARKEGIDQYIPETFWRSFIIES